jgi:hypothetical protein
MTRTDLLEFVTLRPSASFRRRFGEPPPFSTSTRRRSSLASDRSDSSWIPAVAAAAIHDIERLPVDTVGLSEEVNRVFMTRREAMSRPDIQGFHMPLLEYS